MKLSKFCEENLVTFNLNSTTKDDVIKELVDLISNSAMVKDGDFKAAKLAINRCRISSRNMQLLIYMSCSRLLFFSLL